MGRQFDAEQIAEAMQVLTPRSNMLKKMVKMPLIGDVVTSFREVFHFRKFFICKRVLAENGVSNKSLITNFAAALFWGWLMSFAWKIVVAGAIVTFTQPNTLSVLLLLVGIFVVVQFLQSLITCSAFGIGTWRHARGKATPITNIPRKTNIFTPKNFGEDVIGFDTPLLPRLMKPTTTPLPSSLPMKSSALKGDAAILVGQLIDDVNALMSRGQYRLDELWPELIALYYLDFYVAQVRNGGHSQFTHNAQSNFEQVLNAVEQALADTQMHNVAEVFHAFRTWCENNPRLVPEQTGFEGGRAPELDALDSALYKALEDAEYPKAQAEWVNRWCFVKAVDDSGYATAHRDLLDGNPNLKRRKLTQKLNTTRALLGHREQLGAMLALDTEGHRALFLSLQNGAHYDFEDTQAFAWRFHHSDGPGYLRVLEDGFAYHPQIGEEIAVPSFQSGATQEELSAAFDAYSNSKNKPRPGPEVSQVSFSQIADLQERLENGAFADMVFATLLAAGLSTDIRGMLLTRYPSEKENNLVVLLGLETSSVYRVEIVDQVLTAVVEIAKDQSGPIKKFEQGPLRDFINDLEAEPASPWARAQET